MSTQSTAELIDFLTKRQLLSHAHLEVVSRERDQYASPAQLTDELVSRGWLTKYQQSYLLSGQGDKLLLGPYRLVEPLGEGGMGMVFKGWHPRLDRLVALKLIRPQVLASRPEIITRFHREARAVAQLHHPNVVLLYDADEIDGTHYIAMEFVDGVTLEKMVRQNGPLAIKQACDYMRQAALGLQHASECGLVHRDIKPSNILVTQKTSGSAAKRSSSALKRPALVTVRDRELKVENSINGRPDQAWGVVKVLDMGLARLQESLEEEDPNPPTPLTRAGALLGTPDFISPEQARDARSVDIRADLYSLGCTFYYVLTGRPPFPGGNDVQKLIKHQTEKPFPISDLRPHVPTFVVGLVERLMAKKPEDRFQTPQELANALADYLASTGGASARGAGDRTDPMMGPPSPVPSSPVVAPAPATDLPDLLEGFDSTGPGRSTNHLTTMPHGDEKRPSNDVSPSSSARAHNGVVSAVALTADGRYAASGGVDGILKVWDLGSSPPREAASLSRPGTEIQAVAFAPDDPQYLVYGGTVQGNARLQRWDWSDNRVFDWGGFSTTDHRGVGRVAFAADGTLFAAGVGSFAVTWKVHKRNAAGRNVLKGQGYPIKALAFSPDHRLLATAGEGPGIRLWGFGWLGTSLKATVEALGPGVNSLAFSPDGKRLASAGMDRQIAVWDALAPGPDPVAVLTGINGNYRHVQYMADGRHLLSINETGQVLLWDVGTTLVTQEYDIDLKLAYSVAVAADGRRVVAGYSNGHIAVFNVDVSVPIAIPSSPVLAGKR